MYVSTTSVRAKAIHSFMEELSHPSFVKGVDFEICLFGEKTITGSKFRNETLKHFISPEKAKSEGNISNTSSWHC